MGICRNGDITIIELKKDKTPRDVIAQALDYASWVCNLEYKDIDEITYKFLNKDLKTAFQEFYEEEIPENINSNHKMLIIASEFDDSTQRIMQYLTEMYHIPTLQNIYFSKYFS